MRSRAFTLIEVLVVVTLLALLIAILTPALRGAMVRSRVLKGGGNLQQIAQAISMHLDEQDGALPQLKIAPNGAVSDTPASAIFPWLYGGRRSAARIYRANKIGADQRPLNAYLGAFGPDEEVEVFHDPLDTGTRNKSLLSLVPKDDHDARSSMYRLVGTSYLLNDHALDQVPCPFVEIFPTLVPTEGGRMPTVETPSETWLVGQAPIYNYDDDDDAQQRWIDSRVRASLAFVDGHVELGVPVAPSTTNRTGEYTFFPRPDWASRFEHLAGATSGQ